MEAKMMHRLVFASVMGAALAGCLGGCMLRDETHVDGRGTGDETTNGIAGILTDGTSPMAFRLVTLYQSSYDPVAGGPPVATDTTDGNGRYWFANPEPGAYSVESSDSERDLQALIQGVEYGPHGSRLQLPAMAMLPSGHLKISLADTILFQGGHIYLPGTNRYTEITPMDRQRGYLEFPVPEGRYEYILYRNPSAITLNLAAVPVTVASHDTALVGIFDAWKYSARVVINTSATGAGVTEDVQGFPLLIRLDKSRIDFSKARSDGGDLRFSSADGRRDLAYEIETWDTVAGEAAIWVKVDSLRGNDSTQAILMHWGNPALKARSSGSAVFGTDLGYFGVWHLSGRGGDSARAHRDATAEGNHGTGVGLGPTSGTSGVVGGAQQFQGGYISGNFAAVPDGQSAFSFSFWMNVGANNAGMGILRLGSDSATIGFRYNVRLDSAGKSGTLETGLPDSLGKLNVIPLGSGLGEWVHMTSTYEPNSQVLITYLNGKAVDRDTLPRLNINYRQGFCFGKSFPSDGYGSFIGMLDEVRFQWRALSEAWIRMSYENQKPSSRMVRIEGR